MREFADAIYRQILGFGEYGFPESHSASFALLVYVSAWLKCHHPAAFCAALLNSQPMGFYAPAQLVQDARRHGVEVRPPDVQVSDWDCTLEGGAVRLGLRMVSGLSEAQGRRIAARRPSCGRAAARAEPQGSALPSPRRAPSNRWPAIAAWRDWAAAGAARRAPLDAPAPERLPVLAPAARRRGDRRRLCEPGPDPGPASSGLAQKTARGIADGRRPTLSTVFPTAAPAQVAGLVTCRQRPDTASGVVFVTLEDETGCINVVVWRNLVERQRARAARRAAARRRGRGRARWRGGAPRRPAPSGLQRAARAARSPITRFPLRWLIG